MSNYAGGEQVGASWTDKVMQVKAQASQDTAAEEGEGAADDEWVKILL